MNAPSLNRLRRHEARTAHAGPPSRATDAARRLPGARSAWLPWFTLLMLALQPLLSKAEEPAAIPMADLNELSLEELVQVRINTVQGASRHEQSLQRAPSSVSILTHEDIVTFGYRNLAEALSGTRGLYTTYDRNYTYLGIRGFNRPGDYNSRVLGLFDGHRLNENIYEGVPVGNEEFIDIELIDRLEVIRGPSSSIYGNNAFFGVLNMRVRDGQSIGGLESSASGGSFDTYKLRATYGRRFTNDLDLVISASALGTAGDRDLFYPEFNDPATNNGRSEKADEERTYRTYARLQYGEVTVSGQYSTREKSVPTASFGTLFNDGGERTVDDRAYLDAAYEREVLSSSKVLARVYYDYYGYYGEYPYDYADPGDPLFRVVNKDRAIGHWAGTEAQWTQIIRDRHTVIVGADYRYHIEQSQSNYDQVPRTVYLDDDQSNYDFGIFGQGEFELWTNVVLNAGLRYDRYSSFGDTLNPRTALIYGPWPHTTFKALYGTAFRAPNVFESSYQAPDDSKPNPNLDPETIRTYELVVEQALPMWPGHQVVSLSGYYYEIDDLISQTVDPADGLSFFDNLEEVEAKGLELEWDGRFAWGSRAQVSYALQRAEDGDTGRALSNSPRHLGRVHLVIPLYPDRLFTGVEMLYRGPSQTLSRRTASGYVVANLTLFTRRLAPGLDVSASVYNLFNKHYRHAGTVDHDQDELAQDGRAFRVQLNYTF